MSDVGARMEVGAEVPSLQELARRTYCTELALAGEYSRLCLRFIQQCVRRAVKEENNFVLLAIKEGTMRAEDDVPDDVHDRTCRLVKSARWFAYNVLFRVGAVVSAPYVDQALVGTHVEVYGDEFKRMRRGAFVLFESRPEAPDVSSDADGSVGSRFSAEDSDGSVGSRFSAVTTTVMLAEGRVDQPVSSRTRAALGFGIEPVWVVQDGVNNEQIEVGWFEDAGSEYDLLVGVIWGYDWKFPDADGDFFDEDTNDRDFVYDVVILGSARVVDCDGWSNHYHYLARWASLGDDKNLFFSNV